MQRVAVYIDGLNLYYGMRDKGWRRYYWLDLQRLSQNMTRPYQRLQFVRYFTPNFCPMTTIQDRQSAKTHTCRRFRPCPKWTFNTAFISVKP